MTHIISTDRPAGWERLLAEAGIDYVEVAACPDPACGTCRVERRGAETEVAAAA